MDRSEIERYLADLDANPSSVMDRLPPKRDANGAPVSNAPTAFDSDSTSDNNYVEQRDRVRKRTRATSGGAIITLEQAIQGRAPMADNDRPENVVDTFKYKRQADIEAANLLKGAVSISPWSDDYWAIYLGILGNRYADNSYPGSAEWKENFDYIQANPASGIISGGDAGAIDALSPSEKYDLLVGDTNGSLTKAMWAEGKKWFDQSGSVERWMGICHGWSPASYMLDRPKGPVTVKATDGTTSIKFYPADIRGLASLLWANAGMPSRFIGTRNADKNPAKDENGRLLSQSAFDNNPGTWHLAVVNQIGVARRSMVMDATYDYEVWNQPLNSYECHYFNPQTMRFAATLADATVARGDFSRDRFAKYRSADYVTVAGVAMRTRYVAEVSPAHDETNSFSDDEIMTVDYYYDLELDGDGAVLGGEWYLNRHPDFLWTPPRGQRAVTAGDRFVTGNWDAAQALPQAWRAAALRVSPSGLPLARIVEQLIKLSNG